MTDIFTTERKILRIAELVLSNPAFDDDPLRQHFLGLKDDYQRLFRQLRHLIHTSDKQQLRLNELNEKLDTANRFIRQVFGRYLTEDVVETLLSSPGGLTIGGEKRVITILMSDLRGFTAMSERMPAEDVVGVVNTYLSAMTDVIVRYGGTIDEFIGDAVLAFFGAPVFKEDHAASAAACAVEMQRAMSTVNAACAENGYPLLCQGIGVHTGSVVVGNIGSFKRAKYGAVGANINLASRIEAETKGGEILISKATVDACGPIVEWVSSAEITPKGFTEPIRVFNVVGIGGDYNVRLE
jgi:adenylate cyclase